MSTRPWLSNLLATTKRTTNATKPTRRTAALRRRNFEMLEARQMLALAAGNIVVVQNDTGNATTSVTLSAQQATANFGFTAAQASTSRGDFAVQIGAAVTGNGTAGVLMSSVRENGRTNAGDTLAGARFGVSAVNISGEGWRVSTTDSATTGGELNINVAAVYFPNADGWQNGTVTTVAGTGTAGVPVTISGVNPLTDGVLLVNAESAENRYAFASATNSTTWEVWSHDVNVNSNAFTAGAVRWVYVPYSTPKTTAIVGRVIQNTTDATLQPSIASSQVNHGATISRTANAGTYSLSIAGQSPSTGVLLLSIENNGNAGNNNDNIISYQPNGNSWEIQVRDLPASPPPLQDFTTLNSGIFSFVFVPTVTGQLPPVATNDSATINQDTPTTITVLANDTDPNGDPLTITSVTQPANGTVVINGGTTVTYTPAAGFSGSNSFTYTISDGTGQPTSTATVNITVRPNTPPVATIDTASVPFNTATIVNVLANDTDINGGTLTVTGATGATHGQLVVNADNTITYTPTTGYYGADTFSYTVRDNTNLTSTGTVNVTVQPPNTVFQDGLNGYDGTVDTFMSAGAVTTNNATATTLVVDQLANQIDTLIRFENIFGNGANQLPTNRNVISATLRVWVTNPGLAIRFYRMLTPWSDADTWTTTGSGTAGFNATPGVQKDGLEAAAVDDLVSPAVTPNPGFFDFNVTTSVQAWRTNPASNLGWVIAQPDVDDSVQFDSSEGATQIHRPQLIISYQPNAAPVAQDDVASTNQGVPTTVTVLSNDTDPDGDTLTVQSTTTPAHGTATVNANGSILYTPNGGYSGTDTFDYTISDGNGGTDVGTVNVTIASGPTTLVFQQNVNGYSGTVDTYVADNAVDTSFGGTTPLLVDGSAPVSHGLLLFQNMFGSGTNQIPAGAAITAATLEINVTNEGNHLNFQRMLQSWSTSDTWNSRGAGIQADGVEASTIIDGRTGTGTALTGLGVKTIDVLPSLLAWALNPTSNQGWAIFDSGTDGVQFDSSEGAAPPKLTITYTTGNVAPTAVNDSATANFNTPATIAVLANDFDPNPTDTLSVQSITQGANGTVVINADKTITYTPTTNYIGTDTFTYTISDGKGGTATGTVNMTVAQPTLIFQQGLNGYSGTVDTHVQRNTDGTQVDTSFGTAQNVLNDGDNPVAHGLLRFDNLFGAGANQIPAGVAITSARLELNVTNNGDPLKFHRMLTSWTDTATWNSLVNGLQADGVEAATNADVTTAAIPLGVSSLDVLPSLLAWRGNPASNFGWAILPTAADGVQFNSSESGVAPKLIVTYTFGNSPPVAANDAFSLNWNTNANFSVLTNDGDPNGDPLTINSVTQPANGTVVVNADKTIKFTPNTNFFGPNTFTYTIGDGSGFTSTATVTVNVVAPTTTVTYQQGLNGYASGHDTFVRDTTADTEQSATTPTLTDGANPVSHSLLRFENIIGSAVGQIPTNAIVGSATLTFNVTNNGDPLAFHRMASAWADTATWNSVGAGIQADGVEANTTADVTTAVIPVGTLTVDVKSSIQAWLADPSKNFGWAILPTNQDGVQWDSNESATTALRPKLSIVFVVVDPVNPSAVNDVVTANYTTATNIAVLANDFDANGDPVTVQSVSTPSRGTTVLNANQTVTYTPAVGFVGTDTFSYTINDGTGRTATATVTVNVDGALSFQQNVAGYTGTVDTYMRQNTPDAGNATATPLFVDGDDPGTTLLKIESLLRFNSIFGTNPGQVPPTATITGATLQLQVSDEGHHIDLFRMLTTWADTATWNSLNNGIQTDGAEAATTPDVSSGTGIATTVLPGVLSLDVLSSVQSWFANPSSNFGWAILPTAGGTNGLQVLSSEGATPPKLLLTFTVPQNNQAPVNTVPATASLNEDATLAFTGLNTISIADIDAGLAAVRTTVSIPQGVLSVVAAGGATVTGNNSGNVQINGPITAINATLATLIYAPPGNFNGTATLTVLTDDLGNSGPGGALTDNDTVAITVNALNDAPTFTLAGNPPTAQFNGGLQTVTSFATNISAGPADEAGQSLTFSLVVGATTGGLTFATPPAINPTTGTLTYAASTGSSGTASITVTLQDNGSSVAPNVNVSASQTFTITVSSIVINQPPVNTAPASVTVNEDATLAFTGASAISIGDADAGSANVQTTLSVPAGRGTLAVSATPVPGLTVTGSGTSSIVLSGPVTAINNKLGSLAFTPPLNFNGSTTLTIVTNDNGATGQDGTKSDTDTVSITISSVNDAPTFNPLGTPPPSLTGTGPQTVLNFASGMSSGPTDEAGQTLSFVTSVISTTGDLTFTAAPTINPATGALTYTATPGTKGTATVRAVLQDSGSNVAPNVNVSVPRTFTITVVGTAPTIDAPTSTVRQLPTQFTLESVNPTASNDSPITFNIDWDGDGEVDEMVDGKFFSGVATVQVTHEFPFETPVGEPLEVIVYTTDTNGDSEPSSTFIDVKIFDLMPNDDGFNDVVFGGTILADRIVASLHWTGAIQVSLNGKTYILPDADGRLIIASGEGTDSIIIAANVPYDTVLFGGNGNDYMQGGQFDDILDGGAGNDRLLPGNGTDTVMGGSGNDNISGGKGNDVLFGGAGKDNISGEAGNDIIDGGDDNDQLYGADGDDLIRGGNGTDVMRGDRGNDILVGDAGNDSLYGGTGRDILIGGAQADQLRGGDDDDILVHGATTFDADDDVLRSILFDWLRAETIAKRVTRLSDRLDSSTIANDGARDSIYGERDADWLLAYLSDNVVGKTVDDVRTNL